MNNNNQRRNKSYFEQQRIQFNDPNFYKRLTDDELRRQVKRIIRDIRNGNITQQDMIYFQNDRIISACICESYEQSRKANIIAEALKYYNMALSTNSIAINNSEINARSAYCANTLNEFSNKATVWYECWKMFDSISKGCDIAYALTHISNLNLEWFKYL